MTPTMALFMRSDDTERIVFDCDHGKTTADHLGGNGASLQAAVRNVLTEHRQSCRCAPEVVDELWESMAYMVAITEADLPLAASYDPSVVMLAHERLAAARRHACRCDPHLIQTTRRGVIEFHAYHREGCKRRRNRGRTMRWIDLTAAVA